MAPSEDRDSNAAVCRDSGEFGADYLASLTEGVAEFSQKRTTLFGLSDPSEPVSLADPGGFSGFPLLPAEGAVLVRLVAV